MCTETTWTWLCAPLTLRKSILVFFAAAGEMAVSCVLYDCWTMMAKWQTPWLMISWPFLGCDLLNWTSICDPIFRLWPQCGYVQPVDICYVLNYFILRIVHTHYGSKWPIFYIKQWNNISQQSKDLRKCLPNYNIQVVMLQTCHHSNFQRDHPFFDSAPAVFPDW